MKIDRNAVEQALHQAILDQERILDRDGLNHELGYLPIWKRALEALRSGEDLIVSSKRPPLVQSYLCHTCGTVSDDIMDGNKCPIDDCGSTDTEPISSERAWEIERNREEEAYFPKAGEYVPINNG